MDLLGLFTDVAYAQAAAPKQPSLVDMLVMPAGLLIIMYFFFIRPQQRKAKEHGQLLENLKTGDEVVTTGGIIGRVKSVADGFVTLDSNNSSFKVVKSHIASKTAKEPAK